MTKEQKHEIITNFYKVIKDIPDSEFGKDQKWYKVCEDAMTEVCNRYKGDDILIDFARDLFVAYFNANDDGVIQKRRRNK